MIITKTPFRMSFFGGGTDLPDYFKENGGAVISTTFDKYCYVNVRHLPPFFDYNTELAYSKMERVKNIDEIEHPAIYQTMKYMNMKDIRLTYEADLPARSGLGTSSSFVVGMICAFYALQGKYIDKKTLADKAIYIERELCQEAGGWQDQIAASYGGLNRINFTENGYEVRPIIIPPKKKMKLNRNLMMFFTGFTRFSSDIHKSDVITDKKNYLQEMYKLVDKAEQVLENSEEDLDKFGNLLNETWTLKKKCSSKISTDNIDEMYKKAMNNGALGGKLLGAGGGGFFVFYVPEEKQQAVRNALTELMYVPFQFEEAGSKVIYYSPEIQD